MNLKRKMTLIISVLMALIVIIISAVAYFYTERMLKTQIETHAKEVVIANSNKLDGWLASKAAVLTATYATINQLTLNSPITFPMVSGFKSADDNISDLYFGNAADGSIVDGSGWTPPADFDARTRSWYKDAVTAGKLTFGEPYLDGVTKKIALPICMPVKDSNGQLRGVLSEDVLIDTVLKTVNAIKPFEGSFAFLINNKGTLMAYPDEKIINKDIKSIDSIKPLTAALNATNFTNQKSGLTTYTINGQELLLIYEKIPSTQWVLGINIPTSVAYAPLNTLKWIFVIGTIIALLLVVFITGLLAKKFTDPIAVLANHVEKISNGDFTEKIETISNDEIGLLGNSFNTMREQLITLIKKIQEHSEHIAASSEELTASAHQTVDSANQVADSITNVAGGISRQTTATDQVSQTVNAMTTTIEKIVSDSIKVADESSKVANYANDSSANVDLMVKNMSEIETSVQNSTNVIIQLGEQSKKIGQITETISSIASQTNLLALNAAIEAARAGEQGKGFAVVAEEVRKLAEEVQQAAQEISEEILRVQQDTQTAVTTMTSGNEKVKSGVDSVNVVSENLKSIASLIHTSSSGIKNIHSSLKIIADHSENLNHATKDIDRESKANTDESQMVSAAAEEQLAAMDEIATASQSLAQMAQELQQAISIFKI